MRGRLFAVGYDQLINTLLQIKKLKGKRKWKRSHNTEELMPGPIEMAQRKMEEREQQYALEKEVLSYT